MHIHTVDQNYDYQMTNAIQKMLDSYEKSVSDFKDGEELMDWLHEKREEFGRIIVENMSQWQEDADWLGSLK